MEILGEICIDYLKLFCLQLFNGDRQSIFILLNNKYTTRLSEVCKDAIALLFAANIFVFVPSCFADLILTAPPRETPEDGHVVYAPLAEYLSQFLGESVIYEHPINWKEYEKRMKNDEYDIIFDGPHFAAWRIETSTRR